MRPSCAVVAAGSGDVRERGDARSQRFAPLRTREGRDIARSDDESSSRRRRGSRGWVRPNGGSAALPLQGQREDRPRARARVVRAEQCTLGGDSRPADERARTSRHRKCAHPAVPVRVGVAVERTSRGVRRRAAGPPGTAWRKSARTMIPPYRLTSSMKARLTSVDAYTRTAGERNHSPRVPVGNKHERCRDVVPLEATGGTIHTTQPPAARMARRPTRQRSSPVPQHR